MAKVRYTGDAGLVRHDDRPLTKGDVLEIPDVELANYLALGVFENDTTSSPATGDETKE